jgi:hypothetical protein
MLGGMFEPPEKRKNEGIWKHNTISRQKSLCPGIQYAHFHHLSYYTLQSIRILYLGESSENKFLKVKDVRKLYVSKNMISTGEIQLMNFGNFTTYSGVSEVSRKNKKGGCYHPR